MTVKTITRAHLSEAIYKEFGLSQAEALNFIDTLLEEIQEGLVKYGEIKIPLFGNLTVRQKKARVGRNPKTKKEAIIPPRKVVSFYVSNALKKRINEAYKVNS